MPNIGAMLKQEITRLARREVRVQVQATKKASTQYRRHIAALRRQVTALERQMAILRRQRPTAAPAATRDVPQKIRFVAKGLKSQRARLGLSAADFGRLVGVSAQSIYNWEQGHAIAARRPARDTGRAARHWQAGGAEAARAAGREEAPRPPSASAEAKRARSSSGD